MVGVGRIVWQTDAQHRQAKCSFNMKRLLFWDTSNHVLPLGISQWFQMRCVRITRRKSHYVRSLYFDDDIVTQLTQKVRENFLESSIDRDGCWMDRERWPGLGKGAIVVDGV